MPTENNSMPSNPESGALPPREDQQAHAVSARLQARIRKEIRAAGGTISFARFMEMALYAPALGYYSAGAAKLGAAGDFTTAAESSPLFAGCVARQCAQLLGRLDGGAILEFGAGTGRMAAGVLAGLRDRDALPERYAIVEVSAAFRQRQLETLAQAVPDLLSRVQWLDSLPAPGSFRGVVLANEVLDAMAVELFEVAADSVLEGRVGWRDEAFVLEFTAPCRGALQERVRAIETQVGGFALGYRSELCPALQPWLHSVAEFVAEGALLLIDYGYARAEYYTPDRSRGTLMCHYRHHAYEDPLVRVGLQDITAHVDFTAVLEAGAAAGMTLAGYTTQANFLIGCGLLEMAAESDPREVAGHAKMTRQVRMLTLPSAMGERFRVMGLQRGLTQPWQGFALRDLSSGL